MSLASAFVQQMSSSPWQSAPRSMVCLAVIHTQCEQCTSLGLSPRVHRWQISPPCNSQYSSGQLANQAASSFHNLLLHKKKTMSKQPGTVYNTWWSHNSNHFSWVEVCRYSFQDLFLLLGIFLEFFLQWILQPCCSAWLALLILLSKLVERSNHVYTCTDTEEW